MEAGAWGSQVSGVGGVELGAPQSLPAEAEGACRPGVQGSGFRVEEVGGQLQVSGPGCAVC